MKLNHLDLSVVDVSQTRDFFVEHFDFTAVEDRGGEMSILEDDDGFVLVLETLRGDAPASYHGTFHIGFILGSEKAVEEKYAAMQNADIEFSYRLTRNRLGTRFYFTAPGDIVVEVSCPLALAARRVLDPSLPSRNAVSMLGWPGSGQTPPG
ncbi:MAG: VOC family protein [Actinomycetota bacterium]|nr:VOC family protein [Actinomycetota bacterium]